MSGVRSDLGSRVDPERFVRVAPLITNQLLYQLSYAGNNGRSVAHRPVCDKRTGYIRERTSTVSGSAVSRLLITVLR